jgi:hypothetical protein
MNEIKRRVFGCHEGHAYWNGREFDFTKPVDCIRWNFFNQIEHLKSLPRRLRFRVANLLCRCASYLRKEECVDIGWGVMGNRAATLADSLRFKFIPKPEGMDEDEANDALDQIDELGRLAHSNWWIP